MSCGLSNAGANFQAQKYAADTVDGKVLGRIDGNYIIIDKDVDLKGRVCKIPVRRTLLFKEGTIKNGILIGNMTKIECKGTAFDQVTIQGTWCVPVISTKMFVNLNYENALKDVFALSNPDVKNVIVIEKGIYIVRALSAWGNCLKVNSRTDLVINGIIKLQPNNYKGCSILQVHGCDIIISGKGTIIGDKHTHTGAEGEWGMGIDIEGAVNTTVKGMTVKDCWGDCIYVGGNSRNVLIENCTLDHGRRQGISVTKANGVTIRNCKITNVGGTAPECAIDIEPNRLDSVDNILIENVNVRDCEGGLSVYREPPKDGAKTPWIGNVIIKNCIVSSKSFIPMRVKRCEEVKIEKCSLYAQKGRTAIYVAETGKATVLNNTASTDGSIIEKTINGAKRLMGKGVDPIYVKTKGKSIVKNNKVVERE